MLSILFWLAVIVAAILACSGKLLGAALILLIINSPRIYRAIREA